MEKSFFYKIIRRGWLLFKGMVTNISYIPYYIYKPKLKYNSDNNIIVSFTTYPARIKCLPLVVGSIIRQKIKPQKIILYLSKKQFEDLKNPIIKGIVRQGVIVKLVDDDLKSHKKYYYAMQEYPNNIIITIDDDIIYDKNMIADLYKSYLKHKTCISARRVHKMKFDENKMILPYNEWDYNTKKHIDEESYELMATGCGGVLYPPKSLHQDWKNVKTIKSSCLRADDLWLKIMELKNNVPVVLVKSKSYKLRHIWGTDRNGLGISNITYDGNDIQLRNICDAEKIDLYDLVKRS